MTETLDIGLGDDWVSAGTHICALYSGSAQRDELLSSYVQSALRSGDKCLCILGPQEEAQMRRIVMSVGTEGDIDLEACSATRQLELVNAVESTEPSDSYSAVEKLAHWKIAMVGAMNSARFQRVRAVGDLTSCLREIPLAREILRFEAALNGFMPLYPQVIFCMYDLDEVGGDFVIDLVSTHSKVLIDGMLVENPYHLPAEDWLKELGA
jgi:MEDS: MEthanogen/methylotroph, DcmR Sensory domain